MTLALAAEALAHVRAAEAQLRAHPTTFAGKHRRRALLALGDAEDALEEGRQALEGARFEEREAAGVKTGRRAGAPDNGDCAPGLLRHPPPVRMVDRVGARRKLGWLERELLREAIKRANKRASIRSCAGPGTTVRLAR